MAYFEDKHFKGVPLALKEIGLRYCGQWLETVTEPESLLDEEEFKTSVVRLFCFSDYAAAWAGRDPLFLQQIYLEGLERPDFSVQFKLKLDQQLLDVKDIETLMSRLRKFRHQSLIRILWRFILGLSPIHDHFRELSELAEVIVQSTHNWLFHSLCQEYGTPMFAGDPQPLVIVALGKLGGKELNFSSDLDLLLCYPAQGETQGSQNSISHERFYSLLAQSLIKVLSERTMDGFVYRIDLRLRPHGQSGPLVLSFNGLEAYYQIHGRDWERYALIKSSVLTGHPHQTRELIQLLRPFVYRRYLDFTAFHSLKDMKQKVQLEVKKRNLQNNLKLGPGGIRQIEFLVQMFQLIRGGKEHQYQHPRLSAVLPRMIEGELIAPKDGKQLLEAYEFLRRCEHLLQMMNDEQTHDCPTSPIAQARLCWMMGYKNYALFSQSLKALLNRVLKQFERISTPLSSLESEEDKSVTLCRKIWSQLKDTSVQRKLAKKIDVSETFFKSLLEFKSSKLIQSLRSQARERLDQFMPALLSQLMAYDRKEILLPRLLKVIRKIVRRSSYLLLMNENPKALERFVKLCSQSPWIAQKMADYPMLIDELLSPLDENLMFEKSVLAQALENSLQWLDDDLDKHMERLRQFKLVHTLKLAIHELTGPEIDVGSALTALAEVILEKIYVLSCQFVQAKFKIENHVLPPLGIIAYGNFGSADLRYDSDLDLVFIYQHDTWPATDFSIDEYYLRLAQRMIHMLSTQTLSGKLYEVDVRLRPGGSAGLLVTRLQAFAKYLEQDAWTWEHQALVRARLTMGDASLTQAFKDLRKRVLGQPRSKEILRQAILEMREKQLTHSIPHGVIDLKLSPGTLSDIEFIVQYYVLRYAHQHPKLLELTKTVSLLEEVEALNLMPSEWSQRLKSAQHHYQHLLRLKLLTQEPFEEETVAQWQQHVRSIWTQVFEV